MSERTQPDEARYLVEPSDARPAEFAKIDKDGFARGALRALKQLNLLPPSSIDKGERDDG